MTKEILRQYAQEGFEILDDQEHDLLVEYIEKEQEECPEPLFRGINVSEDHEISTSEKVRFKEGFASFDENYEVAEEFAKRGAKGIVFELEDAEGLPVYMHTDERCNDETEWLVLGGEFEVIEVEELDEITEVKIKRAE